jgi:hypothetical protein
LWFLSQISTTSPPPPFSVSSSSTTILGESDAADDDDAGERFSDAASVGLLSMVETVRILAAFLSSCLDYSKINKV